MAPNMLMINVFIGKVVDSLIGINPIRYLKTLPKKPPNPTIKHS